MGSLTRFTISEETAKILKESRVFGNTLYLPETQLERQQYEDVNKVLIALGAKWNRKEKGHVFDYDIKEQLRIAIENKEVTDWKKSTDFFYTPALVVNEMLGQVPQPSQGFFKILEPSAGQGHILDLVIESFPNAELLVVEQNPMHCERLKQKGYEPINDDFMNIKPTNVDCVLMNPPFSFEMEHIMHAYEFLAEEGQLITIASGGILTKQTKKGKEFLQWFNDVGGYDYRLPQNSFKESGTSVETKMLIINK